MKPSSFIGNIIMELASPRAQMPMKILTNGKLASLMHILETCYKNSSFISNIAMKC